MKSMRLIVSVMLIALMATMLPFETDVSLAKRKTPPSKVYGLRLVKATKSSITIKWRKTRRARKYIVYRSRGSKGRFVKRTVTSRTRFTDYRVRQGTVYRYFVRGYNGRVGRRSSILKVRARSSRYVVKSWKIGGNGANLYNYNKQAWSTVKALLYSDGLFEIRGKGNTANFNGNPPWYKLKNPRTGKTYNKQIRRVYISASVKPTSMSFMFRGCEKLGSINRIPYSVKNMTSAFEGCSSIVSVPELPDGVEYMRGAFSGCRLIRTAPELPNNVENLAWAFQNCKSLKEAPDIPLAAKWLDGTFSGCSSLRKAATIKKGNVIESAEGLYRGCKKLRGEIWILGAVRQTANMREFFSGAATAEGAGLKLRCRIGEKEDITGVGTTIDKMLDSKSKNSKITEKPYFVKESPVLKSWKIGGDGKTLYNHDKQGASNVVATLHEDGLLKIVGKGNTAPFYHRSGEVGYSPWEKSQINGTDCNKLIKYVYVDRNVGATNITGWFYDCKNLHKVNRLPGTAKEMIYTFLECKNLYTSPAIPKGVIDMEDAFSYSGLKTPPVLPEGVKDLRATFDKCENLTQAPAIPKSAEYVYHMFNGCINLRKAADIPEENNIEAAQDMYKDCKNLTGEMYVHGAIKEDVNVNKFFNEAATAPGASLKVMYSSSASDDVKATVDKILETKSDNSNIEKVAY